MVRNKSLIFTAVPTHAPITGEHITLETCDFDKSQTPPEHGLTAKTLWVSLDPYMRGRMRPAQTTSYSPAYTLNEPITAYALIQVINSAHEGFSTGEIVYGQFPVAEYSVVTREMLDRPLVRKVHEIENAPLSNWLSILGSTGLTAYSSLYRIGAPKAGETIFVSSAAGAVGLFVGQIAKIEGLRVIGSVGDDSKLDFIREAGFDDGFNYKKERTKEALQRLAPKGIDIYYDNVGGEQFEAALGAINNFGRIGEDQVLFEEDDDDVLTEDSGVRHDLTVQQTRRGAIRGERPYQHRLETIKGRRFCRYRPGVLQVSG